jgi:ABC-type Fe3+/spermidine/putrescine transport system ATPase subunit
VPAALRIEGIHHRYGAVRALDGADLVVAAGEVMALLGPSGSGKSTLLAVLAGMLHPSEGRAELDGHDLLRLPPERRRLGMVFQDYALWPHLSVAENVAFPLRRRGVRGRALTERVGQALERVGLSGFQPRLPAQLSGGQQQRVALARAVVAEPDLLLLDEPLSALDPDTRGHVRAELADVLAGLELTTVLVTHDRDDAFELADRVAVLLEGRVRQVAPPEVAFEAPADAEVATFLGAALFDAYVDADGLVRVGTAALGGLGVLARGPVTLAVAPARLRLAEPDAGHRPDHLVARVLRRRYVGGGWRLQVLPHGLDQPVTVATGRDPGTDDVRVVLAADAVHVLQPVPVERPAGEQLLAAGPTAPIPHADVDRRGVPS